MNILNLGFDLIFYFFISSAESREQMRREYRLHMVTMVDRLVRTEKELDRVSIRDEIRIARS